MAKLPDQTALGERPAPVLPRRTPMIAEYRPTTGMEGATAEQLGHTAGEGYGVISWQGKQVYIHRLVFQQIKGHLPEVVRHTCDIPNC